MDLGIGERTESLKPRWKLPLQDCKDSTDLSEKSSYTILGLEYSTWKSFHYEKAGKDLDLYNHCNMQI